MVVSHKRADREPDIGHAFLTSSVAVRPPFRWMRCDGVAGECPEWQRELTVNQPSYDFEGSSPSSPTILRSRSEQGCRAGAPHGRRRVLGPRATARQAIVRRIGTETITHHLRPTTARSSLRYPVRATKDSFSS